jgi:hypothetical protein
MSQWRFTSRQAGKKNHFLYRGISEEIPASPKEAMERTEKLVLNYRLEDNGPECRSGKKADNPSDRREYGMGPQIVAGS